MNTDLDVSAWGIYDLFIYNYVNLNHGLVSDGKKEILLGVYLALAVLTGKGG